MSLWVIAIISGVVLAVSVVPGMYFWWPTRHDPASRGDFGVNLVTGALVALAIFALQILFEQRLDRVDQRRQEQADRQNLELTIGVRTNLTGIKLAGEDLHEFYFYGRTLREAKLSGADLKGSVLNRSDLSCADLSGAHLDEVDGSDLVLEGVNLEKAMMPGAIMSSSHRSAAGCDDGRRHHPKLDRAVLTNAVLDNVRLPETSFIETNFENADLSNSVLSRSDLTGARLAQAGVEGAHLDGAFLIRADLADAHLDHADLKDAKLIGAELLGATLTGADVRGTDFSGADLHGAHLRGAVYDWRTRWPTDFKHRRCRRSQSPCRFR
jgi:uncharacterized protein YjbI with pentapeptide repeats